MLTSYSVNPHWAEGTAATPEQFLDWLMLLTREEQLDVIERIQEASITGATCWLEDHKGRMLALQHAFQQVCEERDKAREDLSACSHSYSELTDRLESFRDKHGLQ
jgi:hypothetical protein